MWLRLAGRHRQRRCPLDGAVPGPRPGQAAAGWGWWCGQAAVGGPVTRVEVPVEGAAFGGRQGPGGEATAHRAAGDPPLLPETAAAPAGLLPDDAEGPGRSGAGRGTVGLLLG